MNPVPLKVISDCPDCDDEPVELQYVIDVLYVDFFYNASLRFMFQCYDAEPEFTSTDLGAAVEDVIEWDWLITDDGCAVFQAPQDIYYTDGNNPPVKVLNQGACVKVFWGALTPAGDCPKPPPEGEDVVYVCPVSFSTPRAVRRKGSKPNPNRPNPKPTPRK